VSAFLACGVAGLELDAEERRLLEELKPGGVVLFARTSLGQWAGGETRAARDTPAEACAGLGAV
jgi:hypothetical protein